MITVTLTRPVLALPNLVITSDPFAGSFHIPEDGVVRPDFRMRRSYAPQSGVIGGRTLLAAVREASEVPLTIYAHANTSALLATAQAELEAATSQFSYDLTLTIDGVSWTWKADPEWPSWGPVDTGMVRARMSRAQISIPVNP